MPAAVITAVVVVRRAGSGMAATVGRVSVAVPVVRAAGVGCSWVTAAMAGLVRSRSRRVLLGVPAGRAGTPGSSRCWVPVVPVAPVVLAMPTAVMVVSVVLVVVPGSSMAAVVMVVSVAPRV